jgi:hypothetical protein
VAIVAVLVSAFAIPFASNIFMSTASVVFCSVFLIISARKKFFTGLLIFALIGSFSLPTGLPAISVILALIVGTGAFAWLIFLTRSPYLAILPVFAYAVTTLITKNWFGSLLCLVFSIPSLILALSLKKNTPRLETLSKAGTAFIAISVLGILASMLYFNGEINIGTLKDLVSSLSDALTQAFSSIEVELMDGSVQTIFKPDEAYNMAHQMTSLLPAAIILGFNAIVYFAQRLMFSLIRITMGDECLPTHSVPFIVSAGAGIVYTLSLSAMLMTNATPIGYVVNTVCQNIFIILAPPLAGMGIMYTLSKIALKRFRPGIVILVVVSFLLFFSLPMTFMFVACFGAYASVSIPLTSFLRSRMNKD